MTQLVGFRKATEAHVDEECSYCGEKGVDLAEAVRRKGQVQTFFHSACIAEWLREAERIDAMDALEGEDS